MDSQANQRPEFRPDTPLWRYMEFGKFALLLKGKVFIPTLSTLRKDADPREATLFSWPGDNLPTLFLSQPGRDELLKWLQSQHSPAASGQESLGRDYFREWVHHLSLRRAVWCWGSTEKLLPPPTDEPWENFAMWNSYARTGVAIRTTFANLKRAIRGSEALRDAERMELKVMYYWRGTELRKRLTRTGPP